MTAFIQSAKLYKAGEFSLGERKLGVTGMYTQKIGDLYSIGHSIAETLGNLLHVALK